MSNDSITQLKNIIRESVSRITDFLLEYFVTLTMGPQARLPASLATTSLIILWRIGGMRKGISQERFFEQVENEIISLSFEIKEHERTKQNLEKVWENASEDIRQRIEKELEAERIRLNILRERLIYLEVLLSTLKTIETLKYKYGEQVIQVYKRAVNIASKIEEGIIRSEDIEKELEKLIGIREKLPEFPYILKEIIEGMLSQG